MNDTSDVRPHMPPSGAHRDVPAAPARRAKDWMAVISGETLPFAAVLCTSCQASSPPFDELKSLDSSASSAPFPARGSAGADTTYQDDHPDEDVHPDDRQQASPGLPVGQPRSQETSTAATRGAPHNEAPVELEKAPQSGESYPEAIIGDELPATALAAEAEVAPVSVQEPKTAADQPLPSLPNEQSAGTTQIDEPREELVAEERPEVVETKTVSPTEEDVALEEVPKRSKRMPNEPAQRDANSVGLAGEVSSVDRGKQRRSEQAAEALPTSLPLAIPDEKAEHRTDAVHTDSELLDRPVPSGPAEDKPSVRTVDGPVVTARGPAAAALEPATAKAPEAHVLGTSLSGEPSAPSASSAPTVVPPSAPADSPLVRLPDHLLMRPSGAKGQPVTAAPMDQLRLVHRVSKALEFARQRDGEVRLRLSPPELGSLRLEVRVRDGVLVARMEAESQETRQLLLDSLPALRDRLFEQGIRVERFDVDLLDRRDQQNGSPHPDRRHTPSHHRHDDRLQPARPSESQPPLSDPVVPSRARPSINVIV